MSDHEPANPPPEAATRNEVDSPEQKGLGQFLPIVEWWPNYSTKACLIDLRAGIFVAILLIPQAMAYAQLAELSPTFGLRAAVVAPVLYLLLGTSRYLAVGPVALVSLLAADAIQRANAATGASPEQISVTLGLLVGGVLIGLGLLKFGFLANFLSSPVTTGFVHAAALIIGVSQLPKLLGIEPPERGGGFLARAWDLAPRLGEAHWATVALGGSALLVLLLARGPLESGMKRLGLPDQVSSLVARSMPMVVTLIAIALTWSLQLDARGVATVGDLGSALPSLQLPPTDLALWQTLLPSALVIAVVGFVTSLAVARSLAKRRGEKVRANQELVALGASNGFAALLGGYPIGGSMSRSAVGFDGGARTPISILFAAAIVLASTYFAAPAIARLPLAVLAAVVAAALVGFVQPRTLLRTWRYDRSEGWILILTFLGVLVLGVDLGLAAGAGLALSFHLWRTSQPRFVIEAPHEASQDLRSAEHESVDEQETRPVLVMRLDETLCFANTQHVENTVLENLAQRPDVVCLLLDFRAVNHIDVTGLEALESLFADLSAAKVALAIAEIKEPVFQGLQRAGFLDRLGEDYVFFNAEKAAEELRARYQRAR